MTTSFSQTLFLLSFIVALLAGCEGEVSGGEQTITTAVVPITGVVRFVNNESGVAGETAGVGRPIRSLQDGLDSLRAGDILVIEDTDLVYSTADVIAEERDEDGNVSRTIVGFKLSQSGTEALPIVIEGRGVNRPVIDQGQTASTPGSAFVGLYLDCVSHVVVRNLEIRNVSEAGITSSTDGDCESNNVVIENNYIHHIYGEKYVGGIRMMGVSDLSIVDNRIHSVFSEQAVDDKVLLARGKGISNILVEGNELEEVGVGVAVNAQGVATNEFSVGFPESISGLQLSDNVFTDVGQAISLRTDDSELTVDGVFSIGNFVDVDLYGNIVNQIDTALLASLGGGEQQSHDICFFNNTVVSASASALDIEGIHDLEVFNNIFYMPQSEITVTRQPANSELSNFLSFSDNNLFSSATAYSWRLNVGGTFDTLYSSLASWQAASTHPDLDSGESGFAPANPDQGAIVASPLFNNLSNGNFRLAGGSPAFQSGRFAMSIGADFSFPVDANSISNPCIQRTY